jgi:hypothetical protein
MCKLADHKLAQEISGDNKWIKLNHPFAPEFGPPAVGQGEGHETQTLLQILKTGFIQNKPAFQQPF